MNKVVTTIEAAGVSLKLVRFDERGGAREVLGAVTMTPEQAHSVGNDLVQAAKSFPGPVDPASSAGA